MRGRPPSCNSQKSLGGGLGGKPFLQIVFPPKKTLMITHIVFFKLKDGTREKVEKAAQVLRGLDGRIGELKGLEVGLDVVRAERSFDIALVARFSSIADLRAYQTHPEHSPVVRYMNEVCGSIAAVDYESGD